MNDASPFKIIQTVPERCRVCYTCVRECPAKAIRIVEGQARVLHERCIGCGNCVRVCSQNAKEVINSIPRVQQLLNGERPVAAILAPSFPAEFTEYEPQVLVGLVKALGFKWVNEVAFGADLVAREYHGIMQQGSRACIATTCPAVVLYVEKYFPDILDALAPVVSPMVASARVIREMHGKDARVVFIGPCVAKKREGMDENLRDDIDAVLTYVELRQMMADAGLDPEGVDKADFARPHGGLGALFPLCGGMLQAANLHEDLVQDDIVSANGRHFATAISEFAQGDMKTRLLELLACDGCIMGAGMHNQEPVFRRRAHLTRNVRAQIKLRNPAQWEQALKDFAHLDLTGSYSIQEIVLAQGLLSADEYRDCIAAESVLRLGNTGKKE